MVIVGSAIVPTIPQSHPTHLPTSAHLKRLHYLHYHHVYDGDNLADSVFCDAWYCHSEKSVFSRNFRNDMSTFPARLLFEHRQTPVGKEPNHPKILILPE